ncbi:MAG TPA: hypothetical protein VNI77_02280 [Nitrososphaera sp.]|nr:hypothetical protein [Nitrososphaera sp.]
MRKEFHDKLSEKLYAEIPDTVSTLDKVMLHIDQFNVGQSYVTAKVENRYGDIVNINIQGGSFGIELPTALFKTLTTKVRRPRSAYVMTTINETGKILVRKIPVLGIKDWLLVYEDDLFLLAVKDAYDELDIRIVD